MNLIGADLAFPLVAAAFIFVGLTLIAYARPDIALLIFLGSLYLESEMFSIETPIGRLRPNLLMAAVVVVGMMLNRLATHRTVVLARPVIYLGLYVAGNVMCLVNSQNLSMSFRIIGLLLAWFLVDVYLVNQCSGEKTAAKLAKAFLLFGMLQALIGVGQMLGEFVRPTGLISSGDSDYFALAMMGNLLVLNTLHLFRVRVFGRIQDNFMVALFAVNVFFSFVRSSWIGYIAGILVLGSFALFFNPVRFSMRGRNLLVTAGLVATVCVAGFIALPNLRDVFWQRISLSETGAYSISENIRLVMIGESWRNAQDSLLIGHGPGAFATQGSALDMDFSRGIPFDPSMATTLMNDTGLFGTGIFFVYLLSLFRFVFGSLKANPESISAKYAVAFAVAVVGLLFSYVTTNGLWLPFSWVYFGIATACAKCAFTGKRVKVYAGA